MTGGKTGMSWFSFQGSDQKLSLQEPWLRGQWERGIFSLMEALSPEAWWFCPDTVASNIGIFFSAGISVALGG